MNTQYGFQWDAVKVQRICIHRGYKIIEVVTPRETLQIHITPTGFIRTFKSKTKKK